MTIKTMPLWRILRLLSVESGYHTTRGPCINSSMTVADTLKYKRVFRGSHLYEYMEAGGQIDPVHIVLARFINHFYGVSVPNYLWRRKVLGNGHHRVKIAWELGIKALPYTEDICESGEDWRFVYPDGFSSPLEREIL